MMQPSSSRKPSAYNKKPRANRFTALAISLSLLSLADPGLAQNYSIPSPPTPSVPNENLVLLQKISQGVAEIAQDANKAIVFVSVYKNTQGLPNGMIDPFEFFFGPNNPFGQPPQQAPQQRRRPAPHERPQRREGGLGSGFFIDLEKGYILTNNHVVSGADEIELKLANGQTYEGKIVGRDQNTDVAVVQVKEGAFKRDGISQLQLGDSDKIKVGDFALALGAPFGLEASLSFGVVSAVQRGSLDITRLGNFIQTDAAINPGNSGGPLLDVRGQVVGINTAIYSRTGAYNGIGFAVPANLVRTVAEQLINEGHVRRGYLGVYLQPIDNELHAGLSLPKGVTGGALVARVSDGSPADKAGIEPGDVIVAVNGQTMREHSAIVNTIGLMRPGSKIDLKVYRDGKDRNVAVTIGQHPEDRSNEAAPSQTGAAKSLPFGVSVGSVSSQLRERYGFESKAGAVVTEVTPGSAADRAGIRPGDVILKADGKPISSAQQFSEAIKSKRRVLVYIERAGDYYFQNLRE